jgi:hypothetical protein
MPNKYFCQGPHCHEQCTTDRFLKSKGIIRGRYARLNVDYQANSNGYYYSTCEMDKYFCSQGCANSWLAKNMECIQRRTLPPFIDHRRVTEGYEKQTKTYEGYNGGTYTSSSIQKISVDNNAD